MTLNLESLKPTSLSPIQTHTTLNKMKAIVEYVWLDAVNWPRSKVRILNDVSINSLGQPVFPDWNFDGSSTGQMEDKQNSEVTLKPCCITFHPLMKDIPKDYTVYIALCECYSSNGTPSSTNTRRRAVEIFEQCKEHRLWFGLEQEYVMINESNGKLMGWPCTGLPEKQGKYYCGNGSDRAVGRMLVDEHLSDCLTAGIKICGTNAEVLPGQWEFQIGICEGIEAADHLHLARFLLIRCAEKFGIRISFEPKPVPEGDWNGSGCHTNFSTIETRTSPGGKDEILRVVDKLSKVHSEHLKVYGDNSKRLTGKHETSSVDTFNWGIGDRSASIRIPTSVQKDLCGYIEDRRPASDCDPYLVTSIIAKTVCL